MSPHPNLVNHLTLKPKPQPKKCTTQNMQIGFKSKMSGTEPGASVFGRCHAKTTLPIHSQRSTQPTKKQPKAKLSCRSPWYRPTQYLKTRAPAPTLAASLPGPCNPILQSPNNRPITGLLAEGSRTEYRKHENVTKSQGYRSCKMSNATGGVATNELTSTAPWVS